MKIGQYEIIGQMTNQNSGFSVWGFGKRKGTEYFIKEFLSPKYPDNDPHSSPERLERRKKECSRFERQKAALYRAVNDGSDGNAVRVDHFFRDKNSYYIATAKVKADTLDVEQICQLPEQEIRRLCAIIAHTMAGLHREGLVHADLKPTNILFTKTPDGHQTAKIIDFDSSFLESDPPQPGDDIVGDAVYFSPEACISIMWEEEIPLTCKMDIFALGVLFHQYFTGELPDFDRENNGSAGEAVAKGMPLGLSNKLPEDVKDLLWKMLSHDPEIRPTAEEVFLAFCAYEPPAPKKPDWEHMDWNTRGWDEVKFDVKKEDTASKKTEDPEDLSRFFRSAGDL